MPTLEVIPSSTGISMLILGAPFALSILVQYGFLVYDLQNQDTAVERFRNAQITINASYLMIYAAYFRVKNMELYFRLMRQHYICFAMLTHTYFLWQFFRHNNALMAIGANMMLNMYWQEHVKTLTAVNQNILKN